VFVVAGNQPAKSHYDGENNHGQHREKTAAGPVKPVSAQKN
jgi:hypothetical protein